jgi:hypothetical protein
MDNMPIQSTEELKKNAETLLGRPGKRRGRPKKPKYTIKRMVRIIDEYTDNAPIPILKECCLNNNWNYDYVMELERKHKELSQSIKRLKTQKEVFLEKMLYSGDNNAGYIFSLKQLGWRDKFDAAAPEYEEIPVFNKGRLSKDGQG